MCYTCPQVQAPLDSVLATLPSPSSLPDPRVCLEDNVIMPFVLSIVITFICLLALSLVVLYFKKMSEKVSDVFETKKNPHVEDLKLSKKGKKAKNQQIFSPATFSTDVETWSSSLLVGKTITGRLVLLTIFLANFSALILYFYDTSPSVALYEDCSPFDDNISLQVTLEI